MPFFVSFIASTSVLTKPSFVIFKFVQLTFCSINVLCIVCSSSLLKHVLVSWTFHYSICTSVPPELYLRRKKLFLHTQRIFHILKNLYIPPKTKSMDLDCLYHSMQIKNGKLTKRTIQWQFKSSFKTEKGESRCKSKDLKQTDPSMTLRLQNSLN